MTRQSYYLGNTGPLFYDDAKTHSASHGGRPHSAIDSINGYISSLTTVNLVFQELSTKDDGCILLGTGDDICIKFNGTNFVIEKDPNGSPADLLTIHGTSGLVTIKNDLQVEGSMQHRSVTDTGPMTESDGTTREIVYNTSDSKFYGCTAGGSPATWAALH